MLEPGFTAEDLAHTRFAFSPLWEIVASVRVLNQPGDHALHLPWVKRARAGLAASGLDLRLLFDVVAGPRLPGFLAVTPRTPVPELADELADLRDVPARAVRRELDAMDPPRSAKLTKLHRNPEAGLSKLASQIESYWTAVLADDWPRIRSLLEGDVLFRAQTLAAGRGGELLDDLAPMVSWHDGWLSIADQQVSKPIQLCGRGLVLVPSVFVWPRVVSEADPRWQPVLRYPPRGIATLWEHGGVAAPAALTRLVGRSRAILLTELASPASSTELSSRTRLSAERVSRHLGVLTAAGLVSARETGGAALYARTLVADGLLADGARGDEVDC
ncbi:DUF5937 family protein [Amycolatopsis sp. H20-H5]|uniref:DUF5937 family protein n=1 Tax=Amycolatopsis sp. H20-H5 TaxID=3046309 RepID=UPI002DB99460|nr:DUF5937 family protein [Amycolatopsis sp. H20-H5]MEC3976759.1 DUF5937 family protein [Amycolatopsis sp. H20-H5]